MRRRSIPSSVGHRRGSSRSVAWVARQDIINRNPIPETPAKGRVDYYIDSVRINFVTKGGRPSSSKSSPGTVQTTLATAEEKFLAARDRVAHEESQVCNLSCTRPMSMTRCGC
eukprot:439312-Prymnesium_polylepis.2